MTTFRIAASSHYLLGVADGDVLPSLEARLAAVSRERYRRIDRFIALAIVGAGECVARAKPAADCGLYLASGVGPVGSNTQVQEQLCRDKLTPKPFNFVNTLGSAAGHYVAKNVGLGGQNLFISSRGNAFQTALQVAAADLRLGIVSQALVGAVEECVLPLDVHRRRQGLAPDAAMAEGSHWVLLENSNPGPKPGGPSLELERLTETSAAAARLRELSLSRTPWALAHDTDPSREGSLRSALPPATRHAPALPFHDSRDAALLAGWLAGSPPPGQSFVLLGPLGRSGVLRIALTS